MTSLRTIKPARAAVAALLALSAAALAAPAAVAATPAHSGIHYGTIFGNGGHNYPGFSGNSVWGGYIAQGSFRTITGSWTMPQVQCNTTSDLYAPWVGIDGYGSQTVEQTGVQVDCSSGSPVYSGWYEMYPAPPQYFSEAVDAGDSFTAAVTYDGGRSYTLTLTDNTKGWTKSVQKNLSAQNISAEAVIESPTQSYPSFSEQDFSDITVDGQAFDNANPFSVDSGPYTETPLQNGSFSIIPG